jgi:hypothetical protein
MAFLATEDTVIFMVRWSRKSRCVLTSVDEMLRKQAIKYAQNTVPVYGRVI